MEIYKKNKWMNQKIRWKFQEKRNLGKHYKDKRHKTNKSKRKSPKRTLNFSGTSGPLIDWDGWSMQHFVPSAFYPNTDYWLHPMSDDTLHLLHQDLFSLTIDNEYETLSDTSTESEITDKFEHLEESEKILLLLDGYVREIEKYHEIGIGNDIQETIRKYVWNISLQSMQCIATSHLISSLIDKYMNDEENKCEYSNNDDLNILDHIYVRGGAIRDCCLLREIRDIDIVLNIYELSREYLKHLTKYHKSGTNDSKCVFWRHYLNKNKTTINEYDDIEYDEPPFTYYPVGHDDIDKICKFEHHIITCNYMLNAKFIVNILRKEEIFDIKSKYFGLHWLLKLNYFEYDGMCLNDISIDIMDQTGNSDGRYRTFSKYGKLRGLKASKIKGIISHIDEYNNSLLLRSNPMNISIPLYPFTMSCEFYDFTVNSMHISLYNILNSKCNGNRIDYNWECKIHRKHCNDIINKYNIIGMNDLNKKILRSPSLNVINDATAPFYFWRFVKFGQKIVGQVNEWQIDKKFLQHTIKHYDSWFNHDLMIENQSELIAIFINKLIKWAIEDNNDFWNRFQVFRCIKFESVFKRKLKTYIEFRELLKNEIKKSRMSSTLNDCLHDFEYPDIGISSRVTFRSPPIPSAAIQWFES